MKRCWQCDVQPSRKELESSICDLCGKALSDKPLDKLPTTSHRPTRSRPPYPLPAPLSDPLLLFRTMYNWLLLLCGLAAICYGVWMGLHFGAAWGLLAFFLMLCGTIPLGLSVRRLLPAQRTNAFYLRAFRNDTKSWPIR